MDASSESSKLQAKWLCFQDLSRILTTILSRDVLDTGISSVRSDEVIPNEYLDELTDIKQRLFLFGGKCRSRTRRRNNLKEICDLWRRVGEEINPENQSIGMDIKKITVGKHNDKRIQKNTYTYNWVKKNVHL